MTTADPRKYREDVMGTRVRTPVNGDDTMFGEDGFTFADFVDVINPLQHIPLVSQAYRAITGDEISPGSRLAGATLFGGPVGTGRGHCHQRR